LGFDGLRAFILTDERDCILDQWVMDGETKEEYNDRIACVCACGQAYFRMWLNDPIYSPKVRVNIDKLSEIKVDNGVYYAEFAGYESHYFVWIICMYFALKLPQFRKLTLNGLNLRNLVGTYD